MGLEVRMTGWAGPLELSRRGILVAVWVGGTP